MGFFKVLNIIVLLGFVNTITYFPSYLNDNLLYQAQTSHEDKSMDFDGDTLLECLFDDVLDIPMSGKDIGRKIFYDNFNFLNHIISVAIKVLDSFILAIKPFTFSLMSDENYFVSKTIPLLGYHVFLFRFKPF